MPEPPTDYYNRLLDHRRAEYASKGLAKVPVDLMSATTRYLAGLRGDGGRRNGRTRPGPRVG